MTTPPSTPEQPGHGIGLPAPRRAWYAAVPVCGWIVGVVVGLGVLCCAGLVVVALLIPTQPAGPQPGGPRNSSGPTVSSAPSPTIAASPTPTSSGLTFVPGLPPEAAARIELPGVEAAGFHGFNAHRLTLSTGYAWAIRAPADVIIPVAVGDPSYNENASVFFQAGPYVLYLPSLFDAPQSLLVGPYPGMTIIDTDLYV